MAHHLSRTVLLLCSAIYLSVTLQGEQINFDQFSGPALFSGSPATISIPTSLGFVTFSGGEILTGQTNLPADQTSVYSSVLFNNVIVGYGNPITITFPHPITNLFLDIFNGSTQDVFYTLADNNGNAETFDLPDNYSGGRSLAGFPATGSVITIYAQPLDTDIPWDFSIDNITFNEPLPASLAPEPASAGLLGFGFVAASFVYRRKSNSRLVAQGEKV